jgi:hypothetical protein
MLSVADHKNTHESITQHEGQRNRTVMGTPTAAMSMLQIRPEAGDASSYEYLRITASTVLAPGVRTHCVDVAINECVEPGFGPDSEHRRTMLANASCKKPYQQYQKSQARRFALEPDPWGH